MSDATEFLAAREAKREHDLEQLQFNMGSKSLAARQAAAAVDTRRGAAAEEKEPCPPTKEDEEEGKLLAELYKPASALGLISCGPNLSGNSRKQRPRAANFSDLAPRDRDTFKRREFGASHGVVEPDIEKPCAVASIVQPAFSLPSGTRSDWHNVSITRDQQGSVVDTSLMASPATYDTTQALHGVGAGSTLPSAPRFTFDRDVRLRKSDTFVPGARYEPNMDTVREAAPKWGFGSEKRGAKTLGNPDPEAPNPHTYRVKSLMGTGPAATFAGTVELGEWQNEMRRKGLHQPPPSHIRAMTGFGFGCSLDEHVRYGQCLDGKCSKRGGWERSSHMRIDHWEGTGKRVQIDRLMPVEQSTKPALHFACLYGQIDLVHRLCHREGADVNALDARGRTPTHVACEKGHMRIVQRLLANPQYPKVTPVGYVSHRDAPDLNIQDNRGSTCLHVAAMNCHKDVVKLLLAHGVDSDLLDWNNKTALDVAGNQAIFQILRGQSEISKLREHVKSVSQKRRGVQRRQAATARKIVREQARSMEQRVRRMEQQAKDLDNSASKLVEI